jgi:hypothetical protein
MGASVATPIVTAAVAKTHVIAKAHESHHIDVEAGRGHPHGLSDTAPREPAP